MDDVQRKTAWLEFQNPVRWKRNTPENIQILFLLSYGYGSAEISERIFVGVRSVENRISRMKHVLGCRNSIHLVSTAFRLNILSTGGQIDLIFEKPAQDLEGEKNNPQLAGV